MASSPLSLLALLAAALLPGAAPAIPGPLASVLDCPVFWSAVAQLSRLPLLSSSYDAPLPSRSTLSQLDQQPTHGLLDDVNCLLKAVTSDASEHVRASLASPHPLSSLASRHEPADLVAAVSHTAELISAGSDLRSARHSWLSIIHEVSNALSPLSAACHGLMPDSVRQIAGSFHVALLAALVESISFPDDTISACYTFGFPIVGHVHPSHSPSFRVVDRPEAPLAIEDLDNAAWNSKLARRVEADFSAGRCPHAATLWAGTLEEVSKGYCSGPFTAAALNSRYGSQGWRAMLSFAVTQQRADGTVKVRRCDDAADSLHNRCTSLGETITCDSADFPARVACLFSSHLGDGGWGLHGGTEDIEMAYRTCPCETPQYTAVALADPSTGLARFFILPGMNFGLASAVNQFNRLPELVVAFLRRRCGISLTHYFDDYCVTEPLACHRTGQSLLRSLHSLLGIPLAPGKSVRMDFEFVFLGVLHDFTSFLQEGRVVMRPKPGRAASIVAAVTAVLASDACSFAVSSSLRGKLQFLLTTVGPGCRAIRSLLALLAASRLGVTRKSKKARRRQRLSAALRAALHFVSSVACSLPPRVLDVRSRRAAARRGTIVVWSDAMWASGRGGLGFVVYFPPGHPAGGAGGSFLHSSLSVLPSDLPFLSRSDHLIGQLELLAAVAVYCSFPSSFFADWDVVHYIDNTSALYSLTKGYSSQPDSLSIIRAFHILDIQLRANVWFNYVATKANVADLPSRDAIGEMEACIRAVQPSFRAETSSVPFTLPPILGAEAAVAAMWAALAAVTPQLPADPLRPARHARAGSGRRRGLKRGRPPSAPA